MSFLEVSVLIIFCLWLITSIWFISGWADKFLRIKSLLGRRGWFHEWRMFIPDAGSVSGTFIISYRDQTIEGNIGPWVTFENKVPWSPWISLVNPQIRLSAMVRQAAASFGSTKLRGMQAQDSAYYHFFLSIILEYQLGEEAFKRQIRVVQITELTELAVMESEFIPIK